MLADSQQLIVFHVFTRSWASVCVSNFFVPVETGAPPFQRKRVVEIPTRIHPYIGGRPDDVKHRMGISLCRALSRSRFARYNRGFSGGEIFPMELKTQALDRLMETLSPVLSQEYDR